MESSVYLGIDVGKLGGLVFLNGKGEILEYHKMPMIGTEYDISTLRLLLQSHSISHVAIENVHAIQGRIGSSSNFSFGLGKGILIGLVSGLQIPFTLVNPKAWQKVAWEGVVRQSDTKKTSLLAAKRLFPKEDFLSTTRSTKPHDGIVDACLIAEYLRRSFIK